MVMTQSLTHLSQELSNVIPKGHLLIWKLAFFLFPLPFLCRNRLKGGWRITTEQTKVQKANNTYMGNKRHIYEMKDSSILTDRTADGQPLMEMSERIWGIPNELRNYFSTKNIPILYCFHKCHQWTDQRAD